MSLKDLMGNAYNESMTVEDVEKFFESNNKIVNLESGQYVSKAKFDELNIAYRDHLKATKDYDELKSNYQGLLDKQTKTEHMETINKYVNKDFAEFVYYNLKSENKTDDKLEENLKEYLKTNKQYALQVEQPKQPKVVNSFVSMEGNKVNADTGNPNKAFNDAIRSKAGRQVEE